MDEIRQAIIDIVEENRPPVLPQAILFLREEDWAFGVLVSLWCGR
jgi:hypothetical protein